MTPRDKARAEPHREGRQSTLNLGLLVFAHPSINQNVGMKIREKRINVTNVDGNGAMLAERFRDSRKIVDAHGSHVLEHRAAVENCIGEGHATSGRSWRRLVMHDHRIAFEEQAMRDRGSDVADASHNHCLAHEFTSLVAVTSSAATPASLSSMRSWARAVDRCRESGGAHHGEARYPGRTLGLTRL